MTRIEDQTKERIASFLPGILDKAMESYARFAAHDAPVGEAKEFSAHHNACKVAIAHIELLIKLARWVDLEDEAKAAEFRKLALDEEILLAMAEAENSSDSIA